MVANFRIGDVRLMGLPNSQGHHYILLCGPEPEVPQWGEVVGLNYGFGNRGARKVFEVVEAAVESAMTFGHYCYKNLI